MFSHLLLLVAIASPASFRVVQNGFQASEPGLRPGQEDGAPTSNSASPAAVAIYSNTQALQKAALQHELTTRSVGGS